MGAFVIFGGFSNSYAEVVNYGVLRQILCRTEHPALDKVNEDKLLHVRLPATMQSGCPTQDEQVGQTFKLVSY